MTLALIQLSCASAPARELHGEASEQHEVGEDGTQKEITEMNNGDFFGEIALLSNQPRNATVEAKTDVTALVVTREQLAEYVAEVATAIDYTNYKSHMHAMRSGHFLTALNRVWSAMLDVEDGSARGWVCGTAQLTDDCSLESLGD